MRYYSIIILSILAACARNDYVPIPNSGASQAASDEALKQCRHDGLLKHHEGQNLGLIMLGGAVGGPIGGAAVGAGSNGGLSISEMKPYIVNCMREKGYIGTTD